MLYRLSRNPRGPANRDGFEQVLFYIMQQGPDGRRGRRIFFELFIGFQFHGSFVSHHLKLHTVMFVGRIAIVGQVYSARVGKDKSKIIVDFPAVVPEIDTATAHHRFRLCSHHPIGHLEMMGPKFGYHAGGRFFVQTPV